MVSVAHSDTSFPDKNLSILAAAAVVIFSLFEALTLFSVGEAWLAALYFPSFVYALVAVRLPASKHNQKRSFCMLLLLCVAVCLNAYLGQGLSDSFALVIVASFILLSAVWALAYCLLSLLVALSLSLLIHNGISDSLSVVRSLVLLLAVMVLSHALISQLWSARREASFCRHVDVSTGLANRTALVEDMAAAVDGYRRYSLDISAICIRTNELESWQATFGAEKTAQVLAELVSIWQSRIRNTDTLFRYGTDVFVVLLPNTNEKNASKLRHDLSKASEVYDFSYVQSVNLDINVCAVSSEQTWEQWLSDLLCISSRSVNR
jgi:diguanylate cyclase (GGDEF)-like protein